MSYILFYVLIVMYAIIHFYCSSLIPVHILNNSHHLYQVFQAFVSYLNDTLYQKLLSTQSMKLKSFLLLEIVLL